MSEEMTQHLATELDRLRHDHDCRLETVQQLEQRIAELERELASIDATLARRPALDALSHRTDKIERAISFAKRCDEQELTIQRLEKELAGKVSFVEMERDSWKTGAEHLKRQVERLEKENGELRADKEAFARGLRRQSEKLFDETQQLRLQVARLLEAILSVRNDGKGPVEDAITLSKALDESPAHPLGGNRDSIAPLLK